MADYMAYWKTIQVRMALDEAASGQAIHHAASEQFGKVRPGDTVWIVNIEKGTHRFLLVGRLEVGSVVGQREANRALKARYGETYEAYRATYHLFAIEGSQEPARELPLDPVARRLRFVAPKSRDRLTITDGEVDQQQVRALRQLTPDTIEIFERLWRGVLGGDPRRSGIEGEEYIPNRYYLEGAAVRVLVNRYERDRQARAECIAIHGTACVVCDFDFGRVYGQIGKGFIHVHHITPLASAKANRRVDTRKDLRPVCPNCHCMLHSSPHPPSLERLRAIVLEARK
jgi:predicted HNH restriction endonuclease